MGLYKLIGIINYGLGNTNALINLYKKINIPSKLIDKPIDFENVERIILPGVGSFDYAMSRLNSSNLRDELENFVLNKKLPVLGICVGMQIMFKKSQEGLENGLGWIDGEVEILSNKIEKNIFLPHMGWNNLELFHLKLLKDIDDLYFYFLHSYACLDQMKFENFAITNYETNFVSAFSYQNIHAVQFHPEKSHSAGLKLLKNFSEI